jgi:hypothetical protein
VYNVHNGVSAASSNALTPSSLLRMIVGELIASTCGSPGFAAQVIPRIAAAASWNVSQPDRDFDELEFGQDADERTRRSILSAAGRRAATSSISRSRTHVASVTSSSLREPSPKARPHPCRICRNTPGCVSPAAARCNRVAIDDRRLAERGGQRLVEFVDHRLRRALRRGEPEPDGQAERRHADFGGRRYLKAASANACRSSRRKP